MITPTHVVANAFIARWAAYRRGAQFDTDSALSPTQSSNPLPAAQNNSSSPRWRRPLADGGTRRWFVFGGLAPDLGLFALSAGALAFYPLFRGMSMEETGRLAFDDLFYNDPTWLILQNTFHSPVVLGVMAAVGAITRRDRLLSFSLGCMIHAFTDILVHHNDGPLYLFPLNWNLRFESPVSYWDPAHYGRIVQPIDLAITLIGGGYLLWVWKRDRNLVGDALADQPPAHASLT